MADTLKFINKTNCSNLISLSIRLLCVFALAFSFIPVVDFNQQAFADDEEASASAGVSDVQNETAPLSVEDSLEIPHAKGELLVTYEDEPFSLDEPVSADGGEEVTMRALGVSDKENEIELPEGGKVETVSIEDDSDEAMAEAIKSISSMEGVKSVKPNYSFYASSVMPNDPFTYEQYYLNNSIEGSNFTNAWDISKTNKNVTVAVIDSGCNLQHVDLKGNLLTTRAYDATVGKYLSRAGVAYNGDSFGHGTKVTGVIGAQAENGTGIAGTSWNANILPIRIFDNNNQAYGKYILSAFQYLDNLIHNNYVSNLRVINMSFGSPAHIPEMEQYLNHFYTQHGILNVAAGGNGEVNSSGDRVPVTSYSFPSDYNSCFSITSSSLTGTQSTWCDYNNAKDLAAPGESIYTTNNFGAYSFVDGTSLAAPIVSGAAALMFAKYPSASPYDVAKAMQATATPLSDTPASSGSKGKLNVASALNYLASNITGARPASGIGTSTDSTSDAPVAVKSIPMYRLYNPITSEHFYTASVGERDNLAANHGWNYEGVAWNAPSTGSPVYRLYNPYIGDHHYTMSASERDMLARYHGWNYEGVGWYSGGNMPIYRQYNSKLKTGQHHYTSSLSEYNQNNRFNGWIGEGISWYGM